MKLYPTGQNAKFYLTVDIVKMKSLQEIVTRFSTEKVRSKQDILANSRCFLCRRGINKVVKKANDNEDIVPVADVIVMADPVSRCRITTPVRTSECLHAQCFDLETALQLHDKYYTCVCCVCHKKVSFEDVFVDGLFQEILSSFPSDVQAVELQPDGQYAPKKEEEEDLSKMQERKRKRMSSIGGPSKVIVLDESPQKIVEPDDDVIDLTLDSD